MTQTTTTRPPLRHDVTTALHSDGNYYATCTSCGWYSFPAPDDHDASVVADWHRQGRDTPATGWRGWSLLTWGILGWNVLMLAWICYALVGAGGVMNDCVTDACETGATIGTGIVVVGILFLTAVVDVILAVIWVVTKKD